MAETTAREIVDRYYTAQQNKDFDTLRALVHKDVHFKGALGETTTAEDYVNGLRGMTANMKAMDRKALFADGDQVCQIYDLILSEPDVTLSIAQWIQVRDGKIASLRVFFDPRPLMG